MSGILIVVLVFFALAAGLGIGAYYVYQRKLRRAKSIERGLKMVPLLIHLPPPSSDTTAGGRDIREVMREKTAQAEVLYNLIAGTATAGFKSSFYGQRHMAMELVAAEGLIHFYVAVPINLVPVIEQAVLTAYPGAKLEEAEDHNIFSQQGRLSATVGGELVLRADSAYPIATYANLDRDPLQGLLTTLGGLTKSDGAAVQIMIRPAAPSWVKAATKMTTKLRRGRQQGVAFGMADLAKAAVKMPTAGVPQDLAKGATNPNLSQLELTAIEQIEEKTKHPGFEVLVRVLVSADSASRSQAVLQQLATSFALFDRPGLNGFKFMPAVDVQGLVTAFIFRFFPPELHGSILNSAELATIYHLPDSQFTPTTNVTRQMSKEIDGPNSLPSSGLLFGHNEFRGVQKEIRMTPEDRRRHTYILGQTGTGKSTMLENLILQDMLAGNGFAFIDPHGDSAEKMLSLVPKSRAEDVVYFNPADMDFPLGLNLFEFDDPKQKDFLIQESLNMLYKLYDPNGTGVIGPRFEQWYRNAALTLMSDPDGSTFIEIPKVFTDTEYLKNKFKYLKDSTVIDFWTKEMGQTSDYHKSEMLGYFVSKFGAFQQNEMMRNIIGQTKSAFSFRDIMDNKKILIVNLSKGQVGELNAKLLGMMLVIKFQAAAMSRANTPEDQRADFCLYVDEFQNFSTDSFASILSEARKYRLNLIVGNQFIGQLTPEIRDAVFGNIGTILAHRMGPEDAEFMVKQFTPIFDASDLMNLPNFHSASRFMIGGVPSQPFTMTDLAPVAGQNLELGTAIKQLSAAKFGMAKAVVDADIESRLSTRPVGSPAPAADVPNAPGALAGATPPAESAAPTPPSAPASTPVAPVVSPSEPVPVTPPPAAVPLVTPQPTPAPMAAPELTLTPPAQPSVMPAEPVVPVPAIIEDTAQPALPVASPIGLAEPTVPTMAAAAPIITPEADDNEPVMERTAIGQPLPAVMPSDQPVSAPTTLSAPVSLPEAPAGVAAAPAAAAPLPGLTDEVAAMAGTMPAIGAPPIDLPLPSAAPVRKDTLLIHDITGGKRQAVAAAPSPLDDIALFPPGAEPPPLPEPAFDVINEPVPRSERIEPALIYDPVNDPNANVPLLDAPPPVVSAPVTEAAVEAVPVEPPTPTYDPAADPNAGVPLLAADLGLHPEAPVRPMVAPVSEASLETLATASPARTFDEPPVSAVEPTPDMGLATLTLPIMPEPVPILAAAAEPEVAVEADVTDADELPIHFVDPSDEALLDRPYNPQMAVVAEADEPVPLADAIASPAELMPGIDDAVEVRATTGLAEAVVPSLGVASPVELAQTPPPIGAPPVELGVMNATIGTAVSPVADAVLPASTPEVDPPVASANLPAPMPEPILAAPPTPLQPTDTVVVAAPMEMAPILVAPVVPAPDAPVISIARPITSEPNTVTAEAAGVSADTKAAETASDTPIVFDRPEAAATKPAEISKPVERDIQELTTEAPIASTVAPVVEVQPIRTHDEPAIMTEAQVSISEPTVVKSHLEKEPVTLLSEATEAATESSKPNTAATEAKIDIAAPKTDEPKPVVTEVVKPVEAKPEIAPAEPVEVATAHDTPLTSEPIQPDKKIVPAEHLVKQPDFPAPKRYPMTGKPAVGPVAAAPDTIKAVAPAPKRYPMTSKPAEAVITAPEGVKTDAKLPQTHDFTAPVKAAEVMAKTEEAIDDLLSTSLIHSDSSRHRLPEVEEQQPAEDAPEAKPVSDGKPVTDGARHWVGSSVPQPVTDDDGDGEADGSEEGEAPALYSSGSSHKVIEPLGPITPRHDDLVKELAAETAAEATVQPPIPAKPVPQPVSPPKAKPVVVVAPPVPPVPVAIDQPTPVPTVEDDYALPAAESLAADDVARARNEERRQAAAAAAAHPRPVEARPAPRPVAAKTNKSSERAPQLAKPVSSPVTKVAEPAPKPAVPATQQLAGRLILPSLTKPSADATPHVELKRPDKLAKGEVFVDASGNVSIGQ